MIKCTKCGSEDTIKVSQQYLKSTHTLNTQTTGGGIGLGSAGNLGIAAGTASTTGTIQSIEGQRLAPPRRPSNAKLGCLIFFIFFLFYMFVLNPMILSFVEKDSTGHELWGFIFIIGGIIAVSVWASNRTKSERVKYEARQTEWNKQWVCNRCGNTFVVEL